MSGYQRFRKHPRRTWRELAKLVRRSYRRWKA